MELLNVKLEAVDALNIELRIEKEWRQKLQAETMAEREKDMEARMEVARLRLLEEARQDQPFFYCAMIIPIMFQLYRTIML